MNPAMASPPPGPADETGDDAHAVTIARRFADAIDAAMRIAAGDLVDGLLRASDARAQRAHREAGHLLRERRHELLDSFRERLLRPPPVPLTQQSTRVDLANESGLMREEDWLDLSLMQTLSGAIARACQVELRQVGLRFAPLGGELRIATMRFSPEAVCTALMRALRERGSEPETRRLLLPVLARHLPEEMRPVYRALASDTPASTVQPPAPPASRDEAAPAVAAAQAVEDERRARRQALLILDRMQHHEAETALAPDQAPENRVRRLLDGAAFQAMGQRPRVALEIIASQFDAVFAEPGLSRASKARLSRLQIPMMKAALLGGARADDPPRRLLAGLLTALRELPGDALLPALDTAVRRILGEFGEAIELFDQVLNEFEASARALADRLDQAAALDAGDAGFRDRLARHPMPRAIAEFVARHADLLLAAQRARPVAGLGDAAGLGAADWLDALLASLEAATWKRQRADTLASLPGVLAALEEALLAAGLADGRGQAFLTGLTRCHAALIRASETAPGEAGPVAPTAAPTPAPEPAPIQSASPDPLAGLGPGQWIEFIHRDGHANRLKLTWVSPGRGLYVFSNRQGERAESLSAADLRQIFVHGHARRVDSDGPGGSA